MRIFANKILSRLLWPLSLVYGAVVRLRNLAYDIGIFKTFQVGATVVSIGNIQAGGTGKTPATILLANYFQAQSFKPAILSRGFGRAGKGTVLVSEGNGPLAEVAATGDEPYLMALKTNGIPILVDEDRVRGARFLEQNFSPDVILLDDGFQHRRLSRHVDIVLIDAQQYLENRFLLPAGHLREHPRALERAHIVCLVWEDDYSPDNESSRSIVSQIAVYYRNDVFNCVKSPVNLWDPISDTHHGVSEISDKKIVALAGIANPEKFTRQLVDSGAMILKLYRFRDHVRYTQTVLSNIIKEYESSDAEFLVTTHKDWVKISEFAVDIQKPLRVLEITFAMPESDFSAISQLLRKAVKESCSHRCHYRSLYVKCNFLNIPCYQKANFVL